MATTITTRIQLKNDTAENWGKSTLVLKAGEFAYDTTNRTIRVGNGSKTWSELDEIQLSATSVQGLEQYIASKIQDTNTTYQLSVVDKKVTLQYREKGETAWTDGASFDLYDDSNLDAAIQANTAAIATLNGSATTAGSVAKAVADAKAELTGTDASLSSETSIKGVKKYAEGLDAAMDARMDVVEAAIGTGGTVEEKINAAIGALSADEVTVGADKTLVSIKETNGKISTSAIAIQIAQNQVTGLPGKLSEMVTATETAQAAAEAAQTTANTAVTNAAAAQSTADGAVTDAEAAQAAADAAQADVNDLSTYVGQIHDTTAATVVGYVDEKIASVTSGMRFRGTFDSLDEVTDPKNGDIALVKKGGTEGYTQEYVYVKPDAATEGKWQLFGDEGAYDTKGSAATAKAEAIAAAEAKDTALHTTITGEIATAKSEAIASAESDAASKYYTLTEANALSGRVDVLTGADTVAGSVAKALKDAKAYADTQDTALHTTITGEIATAKSEAISAAEDYVDDALTGYVEKEANKRLMTNAEGTKLAGIAEGAQVNVIETVKVNGAAIAVLDKTVELTVPTGALADKDELSASEIVNLPEAIEVATSHDLSAVVINGVTATVANKVATFAEVTFDCGGADVTNA